MAVNNILTSKAPAVKFVPLISKRLGNGTVCARA